MKNAIAAIIVYVAITFGGYLVLTGVFNVHYDDGAYAIAAFIGALAQVVAQAIR